jgi:hypothetical protein
LPFEANPSFLSIRATAAISVSIGRWPWAVPAIGELTVPTDSPLAADQYRGPAALSSVSFADLVAGRVAPDIRRIVAIGLVPAATNPQPFSNTLLEPSVRHVDMVISRDFIGALTGTGGRHRRDPWRSALTSDDEFVPTRFAALVGIAPIAAWAGAAARLAGAYGCRSSSRWRHLLPRRRAAVVPLLDRRPRARRIRGFPPPGTEWSR